jgi:hypothetical protein
LENPDFAFFSTEDPELPIRTSILLEFSVHVAAETHGYGEVN